MRFKLDENMPEDLATDLATLGHDAATCRQEGLAGGRDATVAAHAKAEGRILVTFDLDFSNVHNFPPAGHTGIVVFRLHSQAIPACRLAFTRLLTSVPEGDFDGNLIVVEDTRVRIRRART
jgi:predicted nuclease of predicted toxin-antitoxin system